MDTPTLQQPQSSYLEYYHSVQVDDPEFTNVFRICEVGTFNEVFVNTTARDYQNSFESIPYMKFKRVNSTEAQDPDQMVQIFFMSIVKILAEKRFNRRIKQDYNMYILGSYVLKQLFPEPLKSFVPGDCDIFFDGLSNLNNNLLVEFFAALFSRLHERFQISARVIYLKHYSVKLELCRQDDVFYIDLVGVSPIIVQSFDLTICQLAMTVDSKNNVMFWANPAVLKDAMQLKSKYLGCFLDVPREDAVSFIGEVYEKCKKCARGNSFSFISHSDVTMRKTFIEHRLDTLTLRKKKYEDRGITMEPMTLDKLSFWGDEYLMILPMVNVLENAMMNYDISFNEGSMYEHSMEPDSISVKRVKKMEYVNLTAFQRAVTAGYGTFEVSRMMLADGARKRKRQDE